ncbi:hypothetical protein C0J52_25897 [Blattella germanica]|nr:hypothetical protein C0J52_25897 [Blattella germanica]
MENEENNNTKRKGKKRIAQPTSWLCNQRKIARVKGLEYTNSKGIVIPAPKPGPPCRCTKRCYEKVGDADDVFIRLYTMESKDIQDVYLQGLIDTMDVARRRPSIIVIVCLESIVLVCIMSASDDNIMESESNNKRQKKIYRRYEVKEAKVQGMPHINYAGKNIPARTTGPDCKCRPKCFEKFQVKA